MEQVILGIYSKKGEEPKRESHFTYKLSFTTLLKEPNSRIRSHFVINDTTISIYLYLFPNRIRLVDRQERKLATTF